MRLNMSNICLIMAVITVMGASRTLAGQGCPFDDGSCQEYCSQQGCNMGYCGHFAWIQCICRKCGDEWSWYDKVRYNPDQTVNQTELESLKLNGTMPIILTDSPAQQNATKTADQQPSDSGRKATLTTLIIPDLSDSAKLDLNDIPEENSEKFLDYLAKNHERLVEATSGQSGQARKQAEEQEEPETEELEQAESSATPTSEKDDETIEIQISTSNNNTDSQKARPASAQTGNSRQATSAEPNVAKSDSESDQVAAVIRRLLKVNVFDLDE